MKVRNLISLALLLGLLLCILCGCGKSGSAESALTPDEGFHQLTLLLNERDLNSKEVTALLKEINHIDAAEAQPTGDGKYSGFVTYGEYGSGADLASAMLSEIIVQASVAGAPHHISGVVELGEISQLAGSCSCNHRSGSADMTELGQEVKGCICPQCGWVSVG